jgi:hypothetical protein
MLGAVAGHRNCFQSQRFGQIVEMRTQSSEEPFSPTTIRPGSVPSRGLSRAQERRAPTRQAASRPERNGRGVSITNARAVCKAVGRRIAPFAR